MFRRYEGHAYIAFLEDKFKGPSVCIHTSMNPGHKQEVRPIETLSKFNFTEKEQ